MTINPATWAKWAQWTVGFLSGTVVLLASLFTIVQLAVADVAREEAVAVLRAETPSIALNVFNEQFEAISDTDQAFVRQYHLRAFSEGQFQVVINELKGIKEDVAEVKAEQQRANARMDRYLGRGR